MVFTSKKREYTDTPVFAVSLYPSIKEQDLPLPITPYGIVAYGFVGQPFLKQLHNHHSQCITHIT